MAKTNINYDAIRASRRHLKSVKKFKGSISQSTTYMTLKSISMNHDNCLNHALSQMQDLNSDFKSFSTLRTRYFAYIATVLSSFIDAEKGLTSKKKIKGIKKKVLSKYKLNKKQKQKMVKRFNSWLNKKKKTTGVKSTGGSKSTNATKSKKTTSARAKELSKRDKEMQKALRDFKHQRKSAAATGGSAIGISQRDKEMRESLKEFKDQRKSAAAAVTGGAVAGIANELNEAVSTENNTEAVEQDVNEETTDVKEENKVTTENKNVEIKASKNTTATTKSASTPKTVTKAETPSYNNSDESYSDSSDDYSEDVDTSTDTDSGDSYDETYTPEAEETDIDTDEDTSADEDAVLIDDKTDTPTKKSSGGSIVPGVLGVAAAGAAGVAGVRYIKNKDKNKYIVDEDEEEDSDDEEVNDNQNDNYSYQATSHDNMIDETEEPVSKYKAGNDNINKLSLDEEEDIKIDNNYEDDEFNEELE